MRPRVERGRMDWVTRARPHVDRCGTAWLLKRFVDREARFRFVEAGGELPADATPFDLPGVKHGHRGEMCTFEVVMADYKLAGDPALARVAALVHDVDLHEMKLPESPGLDAVLTGLRLAEPSDERVLHRAAHVFDALYAREKAREA